MRRRAFQKIATSIVVLLLCNSFQEAFAVAPSTGTGVTWSDNTYFDAFTSQSGVVTSDLSPNGAVVWQLYYTNAALSLPADGVMRLGINSYQGGGNQVKYKIAISSTDNTIGNFGTETIISTAWFSSYTAGGFNQQVINSAVSIPAQRYFLIGVYGGPYYRSFKTSAQNRTAQIGGINYVTAINNLYYSNHGTPDNSGIPIALGGASSSFITYAGYTAVVSIKFKVTSPPAAPALAKPDTPTVASINDTSLIVSGAGVIANSQSYVVSLFAANGVTLLETRTATNTQVANGYSWSGLTPNTNYFVGLTAVGDQSSFSNSTISPLRVFSTTLASTSLALTFATQNAAFRTQLDITANISGYGLGKITFLANGKRIPGCISKSVVTFTSICRWKPSTRGRVLISSIFTPASSSYLSSRATAQIFVANRLGTR